MSHSINSIENFIDLELAKQAINSANDGITITDMKAPNQPLIFVNKAFEEMTGYDQSEVLGKNCRFLQNNCAQPKEVAEIANALKKGQPCRVALKNYKKDGTLFWNELSLAPIKNSAGEITHYIGIQKNITNEIVQKEKIAFLSEHDDLTSLYNYRGFFNKIDKLLAKAQAERLKIAIAIVDIDFFKEINDRYGHMKGNHILRLVGAELLDKFSDDDIISRFGGDEFSFAMLVKSNDTQFFYDKIASATQAINASLSNPLKISLSAGVVIDEVTDMTKLHSLIRKADEIMYKNKQEAHL